MLEAARVFEEPIIGCPSSARDVREPAIRCGLISVTVSLSPIPPPRSDIASSRAVQRQCPGHGRARMRAAWRVRRRGRLGCLTHLLRFVPTKGWIQPFPHVPLGAREAPRQVDAASPFSPRSPLRSAQAFPPCVPPKGSARALGAASATYLASERGGRGISSGRGHRLVIGAGRAIHRGACTSLLGYSAKHAQMRDPCPMIWRVEPRKGHSWSS